VGGGYPPILPGWYRQPYYPVVYRQTPRSWVDLSPLMDVQASQHCSTGDGVGWRRGIGLKTGDSHG